MTILNSGPGIPLDPSTIFATRTPEEGEGGDGSDAAASVVPERDAHGGGKEVIPPSPPSPPLEQPVAEIATAPKFEEGPDDVYRPAPKLNPVLKALTEAGLYRENMGARRHAVACPWDSEHSKGGDSAVYTEPTKPVPSGRFDCRECQGKRHIGALLDHLGVDPSAARCKPLIRNVRGEIHRVVDALERELARQPDYFHSGTSIVRIKRDAGSGDVSTEQVSEQALVLALAGMVDFENYDGRTKEWGRVDIPARTLQSFIKKGHYRHLRELKGLARQPFLRSGTDILIREAGYDAGSGILAAFNGDDYQLPEPTEANARNALKALIDLVEEFHFAGPVDRAASICAMLTATIRSSLPLSPAFSISASRPGSGKSYLASLIGCFGGPGRPHNTSYPTSTEEASKLVLSLMMSNPAVACFDDMTSDWLAYAAINRMLTSETISDRVLGTNNVATARTATFIMGTGNNIRPLRDMARRVVSIYLSPRVQDITDLRYDGNPVKQVRADRARYVAHALTIISAYIAANVPKPDLPSVPSFDEWSRLCRESLVWLGEPDPAASLIAQVNDDPDVQLLGELLSHWYECFRERPTMVRTVIEKAETDSALKEILLELPVAERNVVNPSKLGRFLSRHANRIVNGLEIQQSHNGERPSWKVVATDEMLKAKAASVRELPFEPGRAWVKDAPPNGGAAPGEVF